MAPDRCPLPHRSVFAFVVRARLGFIVGAEARSVSFAGAGSFHLPRRNAANVPHQVPCLVSRRRSRDVAVPFPDRQSDPPRCCVDLQCLTVRRSRSSGFSAPPTSLCLSAWTLACSVVRPSVQFPERWVTTPGLSLTLEDLARFPVRAPALPTMAQPRSRPSPLRFHAPSTLSAQRIRVPARAAPSNKFKVPNPTLVAGFHSRAVRLRRFSRP